MVSFKSLFVVAAAALAAFASPLPESATSLEVRGDSVAAFAARDLAVDAAAVVGRAEAAALGGCDCNTLGEIVIAVKADIDVHINALNRAIDAKADVRVIVDIIAKIDVVIRAAVDKVGRLSVQAALQVQVSLFVQVFASIIVSLQAAVKHCGNVDVLVSIIARINVSISALLKLCFHLNVNLGRQFCNLLDVNVVGIIKVLGLVDIVATIKVYLNVNLLGILGIHVGINL